MNLDVVEISGRNMSLFDIESVLFGGAKIEVSEQIMDNVSASFLFLQSFAADKVIYGVNTGFGPMAQYRIDDGDLRRLQYNIIRSHATGAGTPIEPLYVKAALVCRLCTLTQGFSGVHPDIIRVLSDFVNHSIFPVVPSHGSVGASGDLVQLAHIALALIGEGEVFYEGVLYPTTEVLEKLNIKPFDIRIREGLALTNGTSMMTGIGLVNLLYAKKLLQGALIASSMVNEIASSYDDFMSSELNRVKHHDGQIETARFMRLWLADSKMLIKRENLLYKNTTEKFFKHKVQPFYSLRCIPQILGPVWDEMQNAEKVLINELNSVSDNPVIDRKSGNVYHGGNFHGDYVSFEMDKLKIAVTKLTMLMERQLNYLLHDKINGVLPPFVNLGKPGLDYGMQAMQFTATSTTAENQTLSYPMYLHSIPNNNDNQDIVSMGANAALIAKSVIENSFQVMSIHFMTILQAVDCLKIYDRLSSESKVIYDEIRSFFPTFVTDKPKYKDISRVIEFLKAIKTTIW